MRVREQDGPYVNAHGEQIYVELRIPIRDASFLLWELRRVDAVDEIKALADDIELKIDAHDGG